MAEQDRTQEEQNLEAEQAANQMEDAAEDIKETVDASETDSPEGETPEEKEPEEKRGFGKSRKKDKKEDVLKERVTELEDKVVRQMAEFENFRKRTEKEKSAMFETGAKSVVEKILPVVDNFERGLAAIPEEEKGSAFAEGMSMIYKQLMTELENMGVVPIEAVGKEFDPTYHNAVMQVENEELGSGVVAQEMQKGYMYRDSVVRHSMVAVTV